MSFDKITKRSDTPPVLMYEGRRITQAEADEIERQQMTQSRRSARIPDDHVRSGQALIDALEKIKPIPPYVVPTFKDSPLGMALRRAGILTRQLFKLPPSKNNFKI